MRALCVVVDPPFLDDFTGFCGAAALGYATPVDMAKELLTQRGESTMALSPASLVTRTLHTTSDFLIILGVTCPPEVPSI